MWGHLSSVLAVTKLLSLCLCAPRAACPQRGQQRAPGQGAAALQCGWDMLLLRPGLSSQVLPGAPCAAAVTPSRGAAGYRAGMWWPTWLWDPRGPHRLYWPHPAPGLPGEGTLHREMVGPLLVQKEKVLWCEGEWTPPAPCPKPTTPRAEASSEPCLVWCCPQRGARFLLARLVLAASATAGALLAQAWGNVPSMPSCRA